MKKVITILFIILFVCCFNINKTYASDKWSVHRKAFWDPSTEKVDVGQQNIEQKANIIVKAIRNIGIVVAVISLMVIGLREMFLSAEEKSKYKESLPGYLLGVVMVVAVTMLPTLIYSIMNKL